MLSRASSMIECLPNEDSKTRRIDRYPCPSRLPSLKPESPVGSVNDIIINTSSDTVVSSWEAPLLPSGKGGIAELLGGAVLNGFPLVFFIWNLCPRALDEVGLEAQDEMVTILEKDLLVFAKVGFGVNYYFHVSYSFRER
ncbi:hypothetical protein TNCV_3757961 [Trichonephila clavipes]|nr:hypothetical protein TNCV_3757961 [Trichonephila clavipes]